MSIPTLDLAGERGEAARKLVAALEDPGFLYIKSVQGFDPDELLRHTKWFFSQSTEVRMSLARHAWNPRNSNRYRGYYPTISGVTCFKEGISFCEDLPADDPDILSDKYPYEPNMWPPPSLPGAAEFKSFILRYYESMRTLSLEIVRLLALGLGKEDRYFDELFLHKPMSTLRLMHYPLRDELIPDTAKKDGHVLTCLEHTDTNFATFLSTFGYKGLQVMTADGSWTDVEVRPDCLVMNAGDALIKTTNRFKATQHRVVDYGKERFSVPFFVEPSYDGNIGRFSEEMRRGEGSPCDDEEPALYGPWLDARMRPKNFSDLPPNSNK